MRLYANIRFVKDFPDLSIEDTDSAQIDMSKRLAKGMDFADIVEAVEDKLFELYGINMRERDGEDSGDFQIENLDELHDELNVFE